MSLIPTMNMCICVKIHAESSELSSSYLSFGSQLKKTSKSLLSLKSSHGTSSSSGLRFIDLILSAKLVDL